MWNWYLERVTFNISIRLVCIRHSCQSKLGNTVQKSKTVHLGK